MQKIENNEQFSSLLGNNIFLMAYFSGEKCAICSVLKTKFDELEMSALNMVTLVEIETERFPEIAAKYRVYSVPVVIFFVDSREYIREGRNVSLHAFVQKVDKIVGLYNA